MITEIMPTWRNLWVQRKRWQRGAMENLSDYGITLATARYWCQQVGLGYGVVAFWLYLLMFLISLFAGDITWLLFWLVIGGIFLLERIVTVWSAGWRARLLAALLFPELAYALFLHLVFVTCLFNMTAGRRTRWGHVQRAPVPQGGGS